MTYRIFINMVTQDVTIVAKKFLINVKINQDTAT